MTTLDPRAIAEQIIRDRLNLFGPIDTYAVGCDHLGDDLSIGARYELMRQIGELVQTAVLTVTWPDDTDETAPETAPSATQRAEQVEVAHPDPDDTQAVTEADWRKLVYDEIGMHSDIDLAAERHALAARIVDALSDWLVPEGAGAVEVEQLRAAMRQPLTAGLQAVDIGHQLTDEVKRLYAQVDAYASEIAATLRDRVNAEAEAAKLRSELDAIRRADIEVTDNDYLWLTHSVADDNRDDCRIRQVDAGDTWTSLVDAVVAHQCEAGA